MNDDNGDENITMDKRTRSSVEEKGDRRVKIESGKTERYRDIRMYKSLISGKSRPSDVTLGQIFRVLVSSDEIGEERALLGSVAFVTVLNADNRSANVADMFEKFWSLNEPFLSAFDENFQIRDLEWFKLALIHGFLQANTRKIHSRETLELALEVLRGNCFTYTKYSYVAYKILQTWMEKASKMNFWLDDDTKELESKLEAIIFSNWDNCTFEIGRRNATQIFPTYLRLMCDKYDGFLEYVYENCVQNLSWQNVTKYTILVEVCKASNNLTMFVSSGLVSCIFTSLTKNHLKHAGTLLYLTILGKLKANEWENVISEDFFRVSHVWESEKEVTAIELLWEQWMKPSVQKFPNLSEYLWKHPSMEQLKLSQTYLARMTDQRTLRLFHDDEFRKSLSSQVVDISEIVRVNAFAFVCRNNDWNDVPKKAEPFIDVKRFLYFNAKPTTAYMRSGIGTNFKIFLGNVIKAADADSLVDHHVRGLVQWLHEFLLDCLEIGSPYQRKILGLTLYGIILNFTNDSRVDGVSAKGTRYEATLKCANALRMRMIERHEWKFVSRESASTLIRLAVDPMVDVREKAALIVVRYFPSDEFTDLEKQVLITAARKLCNPARVYEDVRGTALTRILIAWGSDQDNCVDYFFESATKQLSEMRKDILKSASQGSSCYGALTTILEIAFTNKLPNKSISDGTVRKILALIENAADFFLSALSIKSNENAYSSSFAEMSIAIDATINNSEMKEEYEECVLSPAHQLVVFCIWMSLKACCELAAEIGCRSDSKDIVERAASLIVSVLLKCRHKGAIEAAGLAVAKLTKSLCARKYDAVMEKHLSNLLSIDDSKDNINLTRRGAGLTIMFHRVVSSDDRNNRPFVHFAMARLLDSLKSKNFVVNEDYQRDSTCVRHLHFLRSLVADKGLQGQLVQYMEDVCLLCFRHLQSPEWTVRNASLQLFGAIVPRLVGQSSSRELDYGIGYSVDHFVTHYPILATSVLDRLDDFMKAFDVPKNIRFSDSSIVSEVVPILTLFSKMSTGGCDLVDYSSKNYIARAKKIFTVFLKHPVFHVRALAAKAFAAFVPLADIRCKLIKMQIKKINPYHKNYYHGQLLAQFYLNRKFEYETRCTDDKFVIRRHKIYEKDFETAVDVQLREVKRWWEDGWESKVRVVEMDEGMLSECNHEDFRNYFINVMLLDCWVDCPVALAIARTIVDDVTKDPEDHRPRCAGTYQYPMLSLWDYLISANTFKDQFLSCPSMRYFWWVYGNSTWFFENSKNEPKVFQLGYIADKVPFMLRDALKTQTLLHALYAMLRIMEPSRMTESRMLRLYNSLTRIDKNRPCAPILRNIGCIIALNSTDMSDDLLQSTISHLYEVMYGKIFHSNSAPVWDLNLSADTTRPDVAMKYLVIECLAHLVERTFGDAKSTRVFERTRLYTRLNFLRIVIDLLMDENAETRELVAEKLRPLTRWVIGQPGNSLCSSATLCKISTHLLTCRESIIGMINERVLLEVELSNKTSTNGSFHSDNEDRTSQRNVTGLLNILYGCATMVKNSEEERLLGEKEHDDIVELKWIDCTIRAKYELQNFGGSDRKNIGDCFDTISPADYVRLKKLQLVKLCNHINDEIRPVV